MRGKKITRRLLVSLALVALVVGTAYAGVSAMGGPLAIHGGAWGCGGPLAIMEDLGVTDAQKRELAAIIKIHREPMRAALEEVRLSASGARILIRDGDPDQAAIQQAFANLGRAVEDLGVRGSAMILEMRGVLTPDQIAALKAHHEERLAFRQVMMEKGMARLDAWLARYSD